MTLTLLDAGRCKDWPEALRIKGSEEASNAYSVIAPLRVLLLQRSGGDGWARSDQLMDHLDDRRNCDDDWEWYDCYIVDFIRNDLGMADVFTEDQVLLESKFYCMAVRLIGHEAVTQNPCRSGARWGY